MSSTIAPKTPSIPTDSPVANGQGYRSRQREPYRWTKEQYHQMIEMGWLEGKPVELIEGEIITMAAMNLPHWKSVLLVRDALQAVFRDSFVVADQLPLSLVNESEPQPDVAVIRGSIRDFADTIPSTAILVVEISDSTLVYDRDRKAALYARSGIAEYWIVNIQMRQIEVYRQPDREHDLYKSIQILNENETVAPLEKPKAVIRVAELLP